MEREYWELQFSFGGKDLYFDKDSEDCYVFCDGKKLLSVGVREREKYNLNLSDILIWSNYLEEEMERLPVPAARKTSFEKLISERE